ncbi:uncharacterized protein CXorf66 homolog [Lepus europaeus]|uniref:uncharacterized protein CXorf66 homolog n=1 Tax=Lepus europaeus TaxID=9983 RepID=UPI002B490FF2|nr:uncharacterized protein CXorf66 homolog [Lepus europaeus]
MNLFIYVLLLSIWTNNGLNTNESNGSFTTAAKRLELMETKMDNFRKHLLIIIIGIMIISFVFTCFCFLHYNCMNDEISKGAMVKKEGIAAKSSLSSKISFSEFRPLGSYSPEKQSMLSGIDKLSGPLSPGKSSIPSSAEKLIRYPSPRESSISSSAEPLIKPSSKKKSRRPPRPSKFLRSSHMEKSNRTHNLERPYKLDHAHKLVNQGSPSYPVKPVRQSSPAYLHCPTWSAKTVCPYHPQNQILPFNPSIQKFSRPSRCLKPKKSLGVGKAARLSRSLLAKSCRCYKERCLVCKSSEPLVNDIPESKKKNTQKLPVSSKVKPFPRSFQKVDSWYNVYHDNVSDSDVRTYDSNDDSDREITIICNIRYNEVIPEDTLNN